MNTISQNRKYEKIIALCFIGATLSYGFGNGIIAEALAKTPDSATLLPGVVLELINSLAVYMIGVYSFKRLQSYELSAVRSYRIARFIEGTLLGMSALSVSLLPQLGQDAIVLFRDYSFAVAMLILSLSSVYLFVCLFRQSLAPMWLVSSALFGYTSLIVYCFAFLTTQYANMWLFAPGAIFEVVFPINLLVKGFKTQLY